MVETYLSLFSGIGGFEKAIHDIFPKSICVGFSEIDSNAIEIYQQHYPEHKNLGDITQIDTKTLQQGIDLIVAGFPCQDLSIGNKNRQGLDGPRSGLFWCMLNILKCIGPRYFIIENVSNMQVSQQEIITKELGVIPILLNSSTFTGQSRGRLFWTNINIIAPPNDINIQFKDYLLPYHMIIELCHSDKGIIYMNRQVSDGRTHWDFGYHSDSNEQYCRCITANIHKGVPYNVLIDRRFNSIPLCRKFHPIEVERLQGFPDNWTYGISNTQRYKTLGNAVNVKVVKHILQNLSELV